MMRITRAVHSQGMEWKIVPGAPVLDLLQMWSTMLFAYLTLWMQGASFEGEEGSACRLSNPMFVARMALLGVNSVYAAFAVREVDHRRVRGKWAVLSTTVNLLWILWMSAIVGGLVIRMARPAACTTASWHLVAQLWMATASLLTFLSTPSWWEKPMHLLFSTCMVGLWVHHLTSTSPAWSAHWGVEAGNDELMRARSFVGLFVVVVSAALFMYDGMNKEPQEMGENKNTYNITVLPASPKPETESPRVSIPTLAAPLTREMPFIPLATTTVHTLLTHHTEFLRWQFEQMSEADSSSEEGASPDPVEEAMSMVNLVYREVAESVFLHPTLKERAEHYKVQLLNIVSEQLYFLIRKLLPPDRIREFTTEFSTHQVFMFERE